MTVRMVVGWDGTAAAQAALDWAVRHEPDFESLELVVADSRAGRSTGASADAEAAAERVRAAGHAGRVTVSRERGAAAAVLAARSEPGVLVVLGGADPGRGRHRSSVAYRVAATATGPVAMVPEGYDHGRDVVLGVGDDPSAPAIALTAADQAARRGQRLVAVHAWRSFMDLDTLVDLDPHHDRTVAREREAVLAAALAPVAERYPSLPVATKVLHGRPEDAVLGAARTAALLVIGRDEEGAARRGRRVAHVALLASRVPVLVVPRAQQAAEQAA